MILSQVHIVPFPWHFRCQINHHWDTSSTRLWWLIESLCLCLYLSSSPSFHPSPPFLSSYYPLYICTSQFIVTCVFHLQKYNDTWFQPPQVCQFPVEQGICLLNQYPESVRVQSLTGIRVRHGSSLNKERWALKWETSKPEKSTKETMLARKSW